MSKKKIILVEKALNHNYPCDCLACREGGYIDQALKELDALEESKKLTEREMREASARAYCEERNKKKILDPDLLADIAKAIKKAEEEKGK